MNFTEIEREIKKSKDVLDAEWERIQKIKTASAKKDKEIAVIASDLKLKLGDKIQADLFLNFFKQPYTLIPYGKDKVLVAVPKFVNDFQVGWLWKETESFYIYQFDQYSAWLGDAPQDIIDAIGIKKQVDFTIDGNVIKFSQEWRDSVKKRVGKHLKEIGDNEATIVRGHIFDVIAEAVEGGCLPFKPKAVVAKDIREGKSGIKLRSYQQEAVKRFMETGAVGVFHPTGAGKSFVALHLLDVIAGKKVIIVPTKTLIEQWEYYISANIPHAKNEIKIVTYQGWRDNEEEYALTVYDECQRLPANTFSRLAVIKTKYRLGLSASPHREDGRESYIFALTGFPVGLNWQEYMKTVGKSYHPIYVHIVRGENGKMKKLAELLDPKKKTMIFCDTIALGKEVGRRFGIPYVYGESGNRLEAIADNKHICVSRVADLGVSVKDLQQIIEVDFLFGSRQQELQRTGRLMHSEKAESHHILMTEKEINMYGKRLWALQEKGFTIKIVS